MHHVAYCIPHGGLLQAWDSDGTSGYPLFLLRAHLHLYGDHAACCIKNGDRILRHHRIRNLADRIAQEGMLNPELEKRWILERRTGVGQET